MAELQNHAGPIRLLSPIHGASLCSTSIHARVSLPHPLTNPLQTTLPLRYDSLHQMGETHSSMKLTTLLISLLVFVLLYVAPASAAPSAELFLQLGHSGPVSAVAFSPDGATLVSASLDKTLKLWDVPSRKLLATLDGHSSSVTAVAFSPDGKMLASGSTDNMLKLWDVPSQKLLTTLQGHSSTVNAVAFSPDGKTLACLGQ